MKYKLGLLLLTLIVNVNLSAGHGIIKGLLGSLGAGGGFSGSFSSSSASSHASAYSNSISGQFTNGGGVDANQNIIDDNLKFGIYSSGGVSSNANAGAFAGSGGGSECCKGSTGTTYDNKPVVSNGGGSISLPASGSSSFANSFSTAGAGSYSTGLTSGLVNSLPGPKGNIHDSKPVPLGGSSVIYKPSAGGNYGGTTTGGGSAITASHPPVGAGISGGIVGTLPGAPGNIHDSKPAPFGGSGAGGIYSGASAGTFTQGPGLTATHPSVGSGISGGVIGSLPGSPGSIHESKPSTSGSFASSVSGASAGSSSGITVINNKPNYGTGPGITATHPPVGAGISGGVIGTLPGSSGSIHDSKPICTGVQPGGKPGCGVAPGLNIQIQGDIGGSTGGLIEAHRGPPPKHFATSPPVGPGGGLQEGVRGPPPVSHELQPPYKASTTYKPIGQSIHQTSYGTSSGSESGSSISIHFDKTDRNDYLGGPVSGGSNGQIGAKGDGITFVQNEHVKPAFVPKPLAVSSGSDIPNIGTLPLEQPHLVSYGPENSQGGAGFGIGGEFQVNKPKDNGYATGEVIVQKPDGSVKPVLGDSVKQGGGGVGFGFSIGGAKSDLFTSKPVVEAPKHVYKPVATVVVEESPKQVFKPATTTVVEESSQQGGGGFGGGFATGQVVVNKPNVYAVVEESPNQGNLYGSGGSGYGGAGYGGGFGIASSGGTGGGYATGDVQVQKSDGTIVGVVEESSKGGGCNGGCGGGSGSYGYSSSNSFGGSGGGYGQGGYGQGGGFGGGFGGSFEGANLGGSLNKLFSAGTAHLKSGLNKIANIVGNGGASGGFSTAGSFSKASSHASSASFAAAGSSSGSYFK